jgi:hypothetical protein
VVSDRTAIKVVAILPLRVHAMLGIPTVDKMPRYTLTNVAVYVYVTRSRAEAMYALDPRHQALANEA